MSDTEYLFAPSFYVADQAPPVREAGTPAGEQSGSSLMEPPCAYLSRGAARRRA